MKKKEEMQLEDNVLPIRPIATILTVALICVLLYPSSSNAMEIVVTGALKTIKPKPRPNKKLGHRTHPLEIVVLFAIYCQFLFFPNKN